MIKDLNYYIQKFANLNVSRSSGFAPNKPILLLSIIELISQGKIQHNQVTLSAELIATFLNFWSHLAAPDRKPDIGLPFFHLKGDKFWRHQPKPGFEKAIASGVRIRSVGLLKETVQFGYFDSELFALLFDSDTRTILTDVLVRTWFSDKTQEIKRLFQIDAFAKWEETLRLQGGKIYELEELEDEQTSIVRDAAFRRVIVSTYNYSCALCGLQVLNSRAESIVDGAHIKPFYLFRDDRINNGLSLCKNHHWAFDRFWFTFTNDFKVIVAKDLRENTPHCTPLKEFHGHQITLPNQHQYNPSEDAIEWHRIAFFDRVG